MLFRSGIISYDGETVENIQYLAEDLGFDTAILNEIDTVVSEGLKEKAFTGCQVVVLKNGYTAYHKAFGSYAGANSTEVSLDSFFDLASLSKTTGTLLAVMKLYDGGRLNLSDKLSDY